MDNLSLEALIQELRPRILNKSIQKIRSVEGRALILSLRSSVTESSGFVATSGGPRDLRQ